MEDVYAKLYHKYTNLKKRCLSELDEVNREQEVKFLEYISVAEEAIQHLKDENSRLRANANNLRDEVSSIRDIKDKQYQEYEKLLMEEKQKNKILQEEVERLQNQFHEGLSCSSKDQKKEIRQRNMVETAQAVSGGVSTDSTIRMTRKRTREARDRPEEEIAHVSHDEVGYDAMVRGSAKRSSKGTDSSGDLSRDDQAECCKRTVYMTGGGGGVAGNGSANCQFQALFEYLVGMKLSTVNQTDGICISALHQSSGYSFTLTWVKKGAEEEPELLYRVLTLGTFERIAPEWMRSVLMFSMRMCPIFFERVACVIKLRS